MGIEYYLVNRINRTFYELGKGGWYSLDDPECFFDLEYLTNEILEECYNIGDESYWGYYGAKEKGDTIRYVEDRIGPDIYWFCSGYSPGDIFMISDCGDDVSIIRSKGYVCIGSRFYDKGAKKYKENIDAVNYHFRGDWPRRFGSYYTRLGNYSKF
jgi:hypothetical protein